MSSYENYNEVCRVYDNTRKTVGVDVEAALIQLHSGKPLKDLHVLDAGCGTGNYAEAFLEFGVGKLTLLDASPGMLEQARLKPNIAAGLTNGRVDSLIEAKMPSLPFKDGTFDAVLFNMVLHHLLMSPDGISFAEMETALQEAHRVVRPNGLVIILTLLPQSFTSVWYTTLIPSASDRTLKLLPNKTQYEHIFSNTKFKCVNRINLFTKFQGESYYDNEGPLNTEWRSTVSFFSSCTSLEIKEMEDRVRSMKEEGTLLDYMRENDKLDDMGSSTMYMCRAL